MKEYFVGGPVQHLLTSQGIQIPANGYGDHSHRKGDVQIQRSCKFIEPVGVALREIQQYPQVACAQPVEDAVLAVEGILPEKLFRVGLQNIGAVSDFVRVAVDTDHRDQPLLAEYRQVIAFTRAGIMRYIILLYRYGPTGADDLARAFVDCSHPRRVAGGDNHAVCVHYVDDSSAYQP